MNEPTLKRSPAQVLSIVIGFLMFAASSPCVIGMLHDIITRADNLQGALIVGVFSSVVAIAGMLLVWTGVRQPKAAPLIISQDLERTVLGVARAHHGRLTVAELAVDTSLTLDQSLRVLEHFEAKTAARLHVTDDGDTVYVFPGFTLDKESAVDPLDDLAMFEAQLSGFDGVDGDVDEPDEVTLAVPQEAKHEDW